MGKRERERNGEEERNEGKESQHLMEREKEIRGERDDGKEKLMQQ